PPLPPCCPPRRASDLRFYKENYTPSERFPEPHSIVGMSVICAETDEDARVLASSIGLSNLMRHRGQFGPLPSVEEAMAYPYSPIDRKSTRLNSSHVKI